MCECAARSCYPERGHHRATYGRRQSGSPALRRPRPFIITRPAAKNLSFGHGIHFCLGAHLAGQEVRAAIGGLLPYLDHLKLTDAPLQRNPTALLKRVAKRRRTEM